LTWNGPARFVQGRLGHNRKAPMTALRPRPPKHSPAQETQVPPATEKSLHRLPPELAEWAIGYKGASGTLQRPTVTRPRPALRNIRASRSLTLRRLERRTSPPPTFFQRSPSRERVVATFKRANPHRVMRRRACCPKPPVTGSRCSTSNVDIVLRPTKEPQVRCR